MATAGYYWIEGNYWRFIDSSGTERRVIITNDVDDTPVDAATTDPVSSNWAYDQNVKDDGTRILAYLGL